MSNVTVTGGHAAAEATGDAAQPYTLGRGGGIAVWGRALLTRCTIGGNRATGDLNGSRDRGAFGGGIYGNLLLLTVQETPEGRQVPLAVMRDGKRQALTATPEARAFSWNVDIDGDRIRRDVERSLEGLRGFRMDSPPMRFRFDREFGDLLAPSSRRRLGVSVDSLGDQLAQYFGATDGGALITSVDEGLGGGESRPQGRRRDHLDQRPARA